MRLFCPLCSSPSAPAGELADDQRRGCALPYQCWQRVLKRIIPQPLCAGMAKSLGFYPNVTVSLRYFYGTFTTSLPPFVILPNVKAGTARAAKPMTVVTPRDQPRKSQVRWLPQSGLQRIFPPLQSARSQLSSCIHRSRRSDGSFFFVDTRTPDREKALGSLMAALCSKRAMVSRGVGMP